MMDYTISEDAKEDIAGILDYTIDKWGIEQAVKYQLLIDAGIEKISSNPFSAVSQEIKRDNKVPMWYLRVSKHHIYYTVGDDVIVIIRVLHEQMKRSLHI